MKHSLIAILAFFFMTCAVSNAQQTDLLAKVQKSSIVNGGVDVIEHDGSSYVVSVASEPISKKNPVQMARMSLKSKAQIALAMYASQAQSSSMTEVVEVAEGETVRMVTSSYTVTDVTLKQSSVLGEWQSKDKKTYYLAVYKPL